MDYKEYYKKYATSRILFTKKYKYFYNRISIEIKNIIEDSSNLLLLSAGHSSIIENLKFKKAFVSEIISDFHDLHSKKNINKIDDSLNTEKLKKERVNEVIISNLEYSKDPVELMNNINKFIEVNGKVTIICNNVFWNPLFKLLELLSLKFKHPRKNLITSNFIHNLCFLSNYDLVKKKKIMLIPFRIPFINLIINEFIAKVPIINLFCLVNFYILRSKKTSNLNLKDFRISIIVPCKNEEKNIKRIIESIPKIGKETEVLFGDDKSTDNTRKEIINNLKIRRDLKIRIYNGPGICKADNVYKGFNYSKGDILVIHDADNTVEPKELKKIITILISKGQNLVIGTRFIYPMERKAMKKTNYLGNLFFSYFYSMILEKKITDTLCGTKVIFKKDWKKIEKYCGTWGIKDRWGDFDLLSGAQKNYMKISEFPINYKQRIEGETKMTNTFLNGMRMLIICLHSFVRLKF